MATDERQNLDEALIRLHRTGPEFEGWLSNHGPMAVEAMARRGSGSLTTRWTDNYLRRLEELPGATQTIGTQWQDALGDASRLGDWVAHFAHELSERGWEEVLVEWWPRLLPGIAAGATHGVIRTGHAVLALREESTEVRVDELGHALGYWAARWQPVPAVRLRGGATARELVTAVPRVPRQEGGIRDRLAMLDVTEGWTRHAGRLSTTATDDVPRALDQLVDAVVVAYPRIAHGDPTMLVHAATAPNAVARTLPALPARMWQSSLAYAWSASAAVLAAYRPAGQMSPSTGLDENDAWDLAIRHGGEHVIKLADTALDVFARTGDPAAVAAITTAVSLDA